MKTKKSSNLFLVKKCLKQDVSPYFSSMRPNAYFVTSKLSTAINSDVTGDYDFD